MSSRKRTSKFTFIPGPLADLVKFLVGPGRTFVLALLILGLFSGACYWGWQEVHGYVLASPEYILSPEDIVVTSRPNWMSFDIREKVFQDASLHQNLSIMDPDLTERIASAFSLHPWVAKVNRVSKRYPASVVVDLEYHHPVCVVETGHQRIPVDVEGNALPAGDLPPSEMERYPRLICDDLATRQGLVGDPWGDPRVVGAAEIAAALGDRWKNCRFNYIKPVPAPDSSRIGDAIYHLYTGNGTRVVWGRPPGVNSPNEPETAEKLAYLDKEIQRYGTLEGPDGWQRHHDLTTLMRSRGPEAAN